MSKRDNYLMPAREDYLIEKKKRNSRLFHPFKKENKELILKKENIGIYPGSFDPLTNGHLDLITRSSKVVDELIVGILINPNKQPLFSLEQRIEMIEETINTVGLTNVKVISFQGLLVNFAKEINANILIRGLRAITDFEYELQMAHTNFQLNPNIETLFLTTKTEFSYISSSMVKEIANLNGDVSKFVPENIEKRLRAKL